MNIYYIYMYIFFFSSFSMWVTTVESSVLYSRSLLIISLFPDPSHHRSMARRFFMIPLRGVFAIPWTIKSMEFCSPECWSG